MRGSPEFSLEEEEVLSGSASWDVLLVEGGERGGKALR